MSIVNFSQQLARLSGQVQKNTQDLHEIRNEIEGVMGPMDALIAKAEQAGSAVANIGGQMAEMVSLNQSNWTPALEGVVWQLYEVQKSVEATKTVSRDLLDQIVPLIDKHMPNFELWLKKILQMAANGEITFDEMQQKIDDFASSVGVTQLNTMFGNDVPGFIIEFRKLMDEIKRGEKTMDDAEAMFDGVTKKAKEATKAVEEARSTTSGMSKASGGSTTSIGASSLGDPRSADDFAAGMISALDAATRR